jgi:5-methylcytosine-specific restriction endonuclease McrA
MSSHKLFPKYLPGTYHSRDVFNRVVDTRDLRIPWAYKSALKWGVDAEQFLALCGPTCKCCNSTLDYGVGKNNHGKKDINTPSTDHLIPQSGSGTNDLSNLWIICMRCNRMKSDATYDDIARLEGVLRILKETKPVDKTNELT